MNLFLHNQSTISSRLALFLLLASRTFCLFGIYTVVHYHNTSVELAARWGMSMAECQEVLREFMLIAQDNDLYEGSNQNAQCKAYLYWKFHQKQTALKALAIKLHGIVPQTMSIERAFGKIGKQLLRCKDKYDRDVLIAYTKVNTSSRIQADREENISLLNSTWATIRDEEKAGETEVEDDDDAEEDTPDTAIDEAIFEELSTSMDDLYVDEYDATLLRIIRKPTGVLQAVTKELQHRALRNDVFLGTIHYDISYWITASMIKMKRTNLNPSYNQFLSISLYY
ncbi:hypothetical protein GcM1_188011 [Golovinomyces cichoracearum]|uniref:Uncharacterized protein n=1 Tax=Golovinomyces cichoracearum TaxID=62708 RepID=A0A420J265_9PEZI|nr:hypothetical protein GcM1_188011 [Golovinomyces cichoracearum]